MHDAILKKIGLTSSEIKVYEALLELGSSSTGKIIDKANVASSKIYEILDKLIDKGLANYIIKGGIKHFEAAPPKRILDYFQEKEDELLKQKDDLKKILPQLELKQKLSKHHSEAKVYRGLKGVETAFYEGLDMLKDKEKDFMFVLGVPSRTQEENRFFTHFAKERAKRGFVMKALFNENVRGESRFLPGNYPLAEFKFNKETTSASIDIFNDRTIIFPKTVIEPMAVVIDNKEVANAFKSQFDMWWNQETKISKGFISMKNALSGLIDSMEKGDTYDVLGAGYGGTSNEKKYQKFFTEIHKHRNKKGVHARMLFQQGIDKERTMIDYVKKDSDIKHLPYKESSPVEIITTQDQAIMIIQEGDEPTIITIENPTIAKSFRNNFENAWNQKTKTYTGKESIQELFKEMLNLGDYIVLTESSLITEVLGKDFFLWWQDQKRKSKIKSRGIMGAKHKEDYYVSEGSTTEFKFIPGYESPGATFVYKDKIINVIFSKEPVAIVIESKHLAENYQKYFELLWNQDTTITKGFKSLKEELLGLYEDLEKNDLNYNVIGAAFGKEGLGDEYGKFFMDLRAERKKRGLKGKLLYEQNTIQMLKKYKNYSQEDQIKFIPYKTESPVAFLPGHEKTLIIIQEEEPTTITINNKQVAKSIQKNFETLWNQETVTLFGMEAVKDVFNEMLEYGSADFFGGRGYFVEKEPEFFKDWAKRAEKSSFKMRNIVDKSAKGHNITQQPFTETKYNLPKEIVNLSVYWIYGNKVVIANWMEEEPVIIIMNNKKFYDLYKQQFEELWNKTNF